MGKDLIRRQAAIDALKGLPTWWADEGGYYGGAQPPMVALLDPEDAVSAIENLPFAQAEPQWIPCSERLPEAEVLCCDIRGEMIIGYPYQDNESETGYSAVFDDVYMIDCIAWMPLPKAYKEGK